MSQKNENEEEYFIRLEFERAKKVEEELKKKMLKTKETASKSSTTCAAQNAECSWLKLIIKVIRSINVPNAAVYGWTMENWKLSLIWTNQSSPDYCPDLKNKNL